MGVSPGEGYGTSVLDFGYKARGQEAVKPPWLVLLPALL